MRGKCSVFRARWRKSGGRVELAESAADEVDDLDLSASLDQSRVPVGTAHEIAIDFDGNAAGVESEVG